MSKVGLTTTIDWHETLQHLLHTVSVVPTASLDIEIAVAIQSPPKTQFQKTQISTWKNTYLVTKRWS